MISFLLALLFIVLALRIENEGDLASRIKNGDQAAFKAFFDRHYATLFSFLSRRGLDRETAEDLVQNAFIAIWDHRENIDPDKSLRSYLFRIGYTRALNHFRYEAKFERGIDFDQHESAFSNQDPAEYTKIVALLDQVVKSLPERRRAVFELCFIEGLSYRETAESLNISIKTVENQMGHALKTVRKAMDAYKPATYS